MQVQGEDKCRALPTQYITGGKHQPTCQQGQLLLFKTVSFKGDELEWAGHHNRPGGSELFPLFMRREGLIN